MLTVKQLVDYAQKQVGRPYWYGTFGQVASTSLYNSKKKQYPSHYTSGRSSRYKADITANKIVHDCVGLFKGAAWSEGGAHTPKYATNGCPDKSANSMFAWAKSQGMANGKMDSFPDVPGVFLHMDAHTGVSIGNGYAVEARGFNYGVVKTKIDGRGWTGWTYLPFVDYAGTAQPAQPEQSDSKTPKEDLGFGKRMLKTGMEGNDVKSYQKALISLNYSCGKDGADGEYGPATKKATIAFQNTVRPKIEVDGIAGPDTFKALMKVLENGETDDTPIPDGVEQYVTVTDGDTVNVRTKPNTSASILGIAKRNQTFVYADETAANGWFRICFGNETGYISNKYTALTGVAPNPPVPVDPQDKNILIVDISTHNNPTSKKNNWAKIAKEVDLLILRCGVTRTNTKPIGIGTDPDFEYMAKKCGEYSIPFAVYFYGKVDTENAARKEADMCWETASPYKPLFYFYDVEESRLTNAIVDAWTNQMIARGAKPDKVGLYVAHHLYKQFEKVAKKAALLWIPRYGANTGKMDKKPDMACDIHQYTSKGDGHNLGFADDTVDLNVWTGRKPLNVLFA